ncbi:MAG: disulfide bond formation protein DsbA [Candidatus Ryanbacteria bacterium CG10_big_fil_rev_8_21_14_0_10_43_42]|uniref:Disulfide bond formation protein DsbA n=1 Tax=Candidatus Ryanbacteria bacterium CG10_big_fil_rev_8_21_14_0_10_43_42 TaxID=1974864 RepID=A0A2M8KX82_9BACT|nr:MAG: disulfide bond formation protein DsbA [Candidatus Ryanbacteria bacterium CG10_big_fil_rev_8_21_14_0_10_43_42]
MEESSKTNILSIPIAIVIAGVLIAGAVYMGTSNKAGIAENRQPQVAEQQQSGNLDQMAPITSEDHIRGNPNAQVIIVEYSDYECPFCKGFHLTMQRIVDEYGDKVAWVYRHFPLDSIHSKARSEALAAECAAELGGNDAFWKFTDRFFELTPSNNQTDTATVLPQIAREIGLNEPQFASCLTSGRYDDHIQANLDNGIATGGNGTPWSIVVTKSGKKYPLSGAQPYASVKQFIDLALQEK